MSNDNLKSVSYKSPINLLIICANPSYNTETRYAPVDPGAFEHTLHLERFFLLPTNSLLYFASFNVAQMAVKRNMLPIHKNFL